MNICPIHSSSSRPGMLPSSGFHRQLSHPHPLLPPFHPLFPSPSLLDIRSANHLPSLPIPTHNYWPLLGLIMANALLTNTQNFQEDHGQGGENGTQVSLGEANYRKWEMENGILQEISTEGNKKIENEQKERQEATQNLLKRRATQTVEDEGSANEEEKQPQKRGRVFRPYLD